MVATAVFTVTAVKLPWEGRDRRRRRREQWLVMELLDKKTIMAEERRRCVNWE